jgi:hypothetical protein
MIERLRAHDVPLVLTEPADVYDSEYRADFPLVVAYLAARYDEVGTIRIGDTAHMRVHLLKEARWHRRDQETGLPCASPSDT